jgi:hypothetical protein
MSALAASPVAAQQDAAHDELLEQIDALRIEQAQISQMQERIDERLKSLEDQLRRKSASASPATAVPPVALPDAASASSVLHVAGDLRLRSQADYAEGARDRLSAQVRGRIGVTYSVNDTVMLGARLVTGDPDDPNSTDVQLSNFDDDLQVSLDQAYVQLNLGDLKLFGGKIPQPFTRTELVWDGDVNPQGVSAVYRHRLDGGASLRANGLFFIVDEDAIGADSTMVGAQLGYDSPAIGAFRFDVSAAYYDYTIGSVVGGDAGDFRSNLRNPDGSYVSDFDLGDVIVGATWAGAGKRWPIRLTADYVYNFGAATSQDTGFGMDLAFGRASERHDWRLTYGYSLAETDAVLAAFSHDNLALATNYELHALTLDYVPLPKTLISAIWYHYRPHEPVGPAFTDDWIERVRVAFLVNF